MRITIETTCSEPEYSNKAVVECFSDDLDIFEFGESVLKPALLAAGFHHKSVEELFGGGE